MKRLLHRLALGAERLVDRVRPARGPAGVIDPYIGYASETQMILRGRVLAAATRKEAFEHASRWTNLRQMVSLFLTDEVADVRVTAGEVEAISDEEGFFTLVLPRPEAPGWHNIDVRIDGHPVPVSCPAFVPDRNAEYMVISDIDDTVLVTGAYSLLRNLWTSLTGNALTRLVYPDAVRLMAELSGEGRNPAYYVSSSPWNLHGFLADIFDRNNLTRGPMFLRDLGLGPTQFVTEGHGSHKGGSIDALLNANSGLPAILVGDTGQHDAHIYANVIDRHPGRIRAVILREADDGSSAADKLEFARIEAAGVPVFHAPQFPETRAVLAAIAVQHPS